MTWVIGASSILGTGALISDVGVRFSDGTEADLLQKTYIVGNYVGAGFAGSVRIGFMLIDSMTDTIGVPDEIGPHAWDLRQVAPHWGATARQIYSDAPPEEKRLGCQLMLVGASPHVPKGAPFGPIDVVRIAAPEFIPRFSSGLSIRHIGTGARVREYKRSMRSLFRITSGIHQSHIAGIHQWARTLAFSVTISVRDYPDRGISEHFHGIGVRRGSIVGFTNDMIIDPGGDRELELRMPPVAHSWDEFVVLTQAKRSQAAGAIC